MPIPVVTFDDNSFDASMAILTVHHWTDKEKLGLKEMRRVTSGPDRQFRAYPVDPTHYMYGVERQSRARVAREADASGDGCSGKTFRFGDRIAYLDLTGQGQPADPGPKRERSCRCASVFPVTGRHTRIVGVGDVPD